MYIVYMDVSENSGTPKNNQKSSMFIGFSIINHPFWDTPIFWKHPYDFILVGEKKQHFFGHFWGVYDL